MKTSELIDQALNYAVAKAQKWVDYPTDSIEHGTVWHCDPDKAPFGRIMQKRDFSPSTDWAQGGPIIERGLIQVNVKRLIGTSESGAEIDIPDGWQAHKSGRYWQTSAVYYGPTPLIAAMRCYVASKLGDEVKVPEELIK